MYIKIRMHLKQKVEKVIDTTEDTLDVYVRDPAENGLANNTMLRLMKDKFLNKRIKIVSGHLHPHKIISIE